MLLLPRHRTRILLAALLATAPLHAQPPAAAHPQTTAPAQSQTAAPVVSGDYAGMLGPLHLILHVQRDTAGRMSGSLDSPDQNAPGIPCSDFVLTGNKFSFASTAVHGTFSGTVSPDGKAIGGMWDQGTPRVLLLTQTASAPLVVPADISAGVIGDWTGAIATPSGPLPAVIHIQYASDGSQSLTFDSPKQGAFGLKGAKVVFTGSAFSFDLPVVHGHYDGALSVDGKSIAGTWTQGTPLPLTFNRVEPPADKPSLADGTWTGILATPNGPLHAAIHVRSDRTGKESVTLDSPDQYATFLDAANATLTGSTFTFAMPDWHATYTGTISADGSTMDGTWTQTLATQGASAKPATLPLHFAKSTAPADKPKPEPSAKKEPPLTLPDLKTRLDAELKPLLDNPFFAGAPGIGVAIGLYAHGDTSVLTYGVAKPDSLFEIGSITKTFTGLILSQMVLENKVALDTPIRELLPPGTVAKPDGPEITLLDLATHHSGMVRMPPNMHPADPANPYADYTNANLYAFIAKNGVALTPHAKFLYSNVGVSLLGQGLANKAGVPYSDLLQQRVLAPLHMDHTFIQFPAAEQANFLTAHNAQNKPVSRWDLVAFAPAGGIRSDARDMLKYVQAQLHPPPALADAIAFQHVVRADADGGKIAINWMFSPQGDLYNHGGGTGGFATYAFFNTQHDIAGIVLVNRESGLAPSLGDRIAELLAGERATPLQP